MSEEKLSSFLKTGQDWGRMKTTVPGLFLLKLPAYRNNPARLAVELNPVDESGAPTKRRGLVLRSSQEMEDFSKLFQQDKLSSLISAVDKVNPQLKKGGRTGEEILQI